MIPRSLLAKLPIKGIQDIKPVAGGMACESYLIRVPSHKYFIKIHRNPQPETQFFQHEVEGLKLIGQVAKVPKVIDYGQIGSYGYLILNWINFSGHVNQYELGKMVAKVHKIHNDQFGLDHDYKGTQVPRINHWQSSWIQFYIGQRLDIFVELAKKQHLWNRWRDSHYQSLKNSFINYYSKPNNAVIPSLLHGDLWMGNCEFYHGEPMLIDPDVFYGDREYDLAITSISPKEFKPEFYQGYNNVYPVKPGIKSRLLWYQFGYQMGQLNFFGEERGADVDKILDKF